jgi:hypothetical protein
MHLEGRGCRRQEDTNGKDVRKSVGDVCAVGADGGPCGDRGRRTALGNAADDLVELDQRACGFRHKIRDWLKVMRKANCLVLMATQSLSDTANSGILDVIKEATASKIFLPNPNARQEDAAAIYRAFGLNDRQIEIIADAVPKRQYYVEAGCAVFS